MDASTRVPHPVNEPVLTYAPGNPERVELEETLKDLQSDQHELTNTVGGESAMGGGRRIKVVQPHAHRHVLGVMKNSNAADARRAIAAANDAAPQWRAMPFDERVAIILRAAELAAGPWRQTLNAATMLGQGKTVQQAEIDAACE
ncbi:MAG TPA: aldehyde dehydrogenase family protein, partial [Nocardioidaceae bacterium]|nr:aldehyde dehydrogenase family protein [Nocardioidaceae bacterium]